MKSYAVERPGTAFQKVQPARQRAARIRGELHLKWIRSLPCVICGREGSTQAAHIRMASPKHGKRAVGLSEKPDDCWVVPLCAGHHLLGSDAQHARPEAEFWADHAIDPFLLALALWRASGDQETAGIILKEAIATTTNFEPTAHP